MNTSPRNGGGSRCRPHLEERERTAFPHLQKGEEMRDLKTPTTKHQRNRYTLAATLLLLSATFVYALMTLQGVPALFLLLCAGLLVAGLFCGHQALARPFPGWAWMIGITGMVIVCAGFLLLGAGWAATALQLLVGAAIIVQDYRLSLQARRIIQELATGDQPSELPHERAA
jgi:hypothetical protein